MPSSTGSPPIVVIDTNVFVGACLGAGASNEVVALCLRGEILPLMGTALLAECQDVLGREALFERSRLDSAEREEVLDIFLALSLDQDLLRVAPQRSGRR